MLQIPMLAPLRRGSQVYNSLTFRDSRIFCVPFNNQRMSAMTRALCAVVFVCAFALSISATNAKPRHQKHITATSQTFTYCPADASYRSVCPGAFTRTMTRASRAASPAATYQEAAIVGGRPAGCPAKFCGCEASLYLFGKIDPYLNLAANWYRRFPRTSPAPRMAAARNGHVMVLVSHVSGNDWLVHDGNSGGGYTRRHVRSISGYRIVDPHGARVAMR